MRRQAAVQADPLPWRDVTRQVCDVRFRNAVAQPLPVDDATLWPWLRDRILFALAAENAAGAQRVLEMTVDYAKERTAFGRPIGGYQAIKHALADMLGLAECSTTAVALCRLGAVQGRQARASGRRDGQGLFERRLRLGDPP